MCYQLKIKVKHLAAESRIIRAEERKELNFYRYAHKLEHRRKHYTIYDSLRMHRITPLRREARATHIAYAFIRDKSCPDSGKNLDAGVMNAIYRMIITYDPRYKNLKSIFNLYLKDRNTWLEFDKKHWGLRKDLLEDFMSKVNSWISNETIAPIA